MELSRPAEKAMLPPPRPTSRPVRRIKRPSKVLEEDEYNEALSQIIARDYFPGLVETRSQQEYLDALDGGDTEWIAEAGRRLQEIRTPGRKTRRGTTMTPDMTPRDPATTPRGIEATPRESKGISRDTETGINTNMSLGQFQQKYTSEDNESFYKLLDAQNDKRAERYAWMWAGNKIPAARQIAHRQRAQLQAANRSAEAIENNGNELVKLHDLQKDSRPAMPVAWNSRPNNALMFGPESIEDEHQTVAQDKEEASIAPPKIVAYDNTRLPATGENAPSSPTLSAMRSAIAGRPRAAPSEISVDGGATPRVNGYTFVDSEEPEAPPVITLGPGDSKPNPFKLQAASEREELHHRMVDKVARGKRTTTSVVQTQTPRFTSGPKLDQKDSMTPAGARLLSQLTPRRVQKDTDVWDKAKGLRRTPRIGNGPAKPVLLDSNGR